MKKGRRGAHRDGPTHHRERGTAVSTPILEIVWTPEDFRAVVTGLRALGAEEYDTLAPVIDITTRARLA